MKPKVRAARALAAYTATRSLRLVSIILLVVFTLILILVWVLAIQVSSWWWIALLPLAIASAIILLLRFILQRIIHAIYPDPISQSQRETLHRITDKAIHLAETRSTPLPVLAFITLKDIVTRRDAVMVRGLLRDSKELGVSLRSLEDQFKER